MEMFGLSAPVADQVLQDHQAAEISAAEKKLLAYVEKTTRHAYKFTDDEVRDLKEIGWTEPQILEATLVAALFNDINRIADALGVQPDF